MFPAQFVLLHLWMFCFISKKEVVFVIFHMAELMKWIFAFELFIEQVLALSNCF